MKKTFEISLVILILIFMVVGCFQDKGKIIGKVIDTQGNPVANATVVTDPGGYEASVNENGEYVVSDVPTGRYEVTATWGSYSDTKTVAVKEENFFSCSEIQIDAADIQLDIGSVPTVSITAPSDGAIVSDTVDVTVDASDADGISKVNFYIDNVIKSTDTVSPYSWSWDTTAETDGAYTIKAIAYDTTDQTGEDQVSVIVNNTGDNPPTVSITNPTNGATVSDTINVTATASDDKGISKVEFYIDGSLKSTDTSSPYSWSWNTTGESNGGHTVKAIAYDTISQTDQHEVSVTVNNIGDNPPTVSITNPTNGATVSGNVSVTANASDDNGVSKVEFYIDGSLKSTDTNSPYSWNWDTTAESDGGHTVRAIAYDTINQTTQHEVSVTVENISPDLVAYYNFNENTGTTASDSSTYGNTATIYGAAWVAGYEGSALSFNGSSAYVEALHSASLNLTSEVTLMAWINPTAMADYQRIVAKPHTSNISPYNMYSLQFDNFEHARPEITTGGAQHFVDGTTIIPTGSWTHVACTYDGAALRLYVDGVPDNSVSVTGAIDTNTMPLCIGVVDYAGVFTEYFNGIIDEIRVYNRALTQTEINAVK